MSAGPENDQPQPERTRPRSAWPGSRRAAVFAGVVAVGVLAGAGVAFAATGSPGHPASPGPATAATPAPSASPSPQFRLPHRLPFRLMPGFGAGPFGFGGPLGIGGPLGPGGFGAIHGQYVVAKPGGGYQTVDFQNGKVTAVSGTSITLRSADGYVHSYAVTSSTMVDAQRDGIGSVKVGNEALVRATVSGGTATAASILDLSLIQQGGHNFIGGLPGWGGKLHQWNGQTPAR